MTAYFVTGTDTDVGKTVISALLVKQLNAFYWKPIQSGTNDCEDKNEILKLSGISKDKICPCSYELTEPLSPHDAAEIDAIDIKLDQITLPKVDGPMIIEGAGGVFVPLNKQDLMIDLIKMLNCPTIIVARSGLGTINHTLLTIKALRDYGIEIAGVILNGDLNPRNKKSIEQFGQVRILGEVPYVDGLNFNDVKQPFITI